MSDQGSVVSFQAKHQRYTMDELYEIGEASYRNVPLRRAQEGIPVINFDFWELYPSCMKSGKSAAA